jgi:hypothetical protein
MPTSPICRDRCTAGTAGTCTWRTIFGLGFNPPEEWWQSIDQTLFPGGYFKEFIFIYKKSKTLILTDTIIKCPSLGERRQSSGGCTIPRANILWNAAAAIVAAAKG